MPTEHHVKALKLLVVSLGLLLIGGAILLGGMVWKKVNLMRNTDMLDASVCPGGEVNLTGRGIIIESRTEDQLLRLTLEKQPGTNEILTIDTCTGKIIGTLKLATDPGMPSIE
jgi:hypothetical protein